MYIPIFELREKKTNKVIWTGQGYYKSQRMLRLSNADCYLVEIYEGEQK